MKTLILLNIVSSNTVYRLNSYIKKHQKKLGKVLVLFCSQTEKNRKWKLNEKINFKYRILPSNKIEINSKDLLTYFINPSAWKEFNRYNPDRLIITGWSQFSYQLAFLWAYIHKRKITLWSGSTINEKSIGRCLIYPLVRLMVRLSDNFIAYGSMAREYLISLGADPLKIEIFINDVNKEYFIKESKKWRVKRVDTKRSFGITSKYNFIYVGQLIKRKGVLSLIQSYKLLRTIHPDWGLVIVGYGKEENNLRRYVQNNDIKNIYFLGQVEQYDLPKLYTACNCLVLPSEQEVWGLVVNEALYCGLKVIVSNKCGCSLDLVKNSQNGYIFNFDKNGDLLRQMKKITL
jgi:glycosyltransferase involved in cell wall biosynthesis